MKLKKYLTLGAVAMSMSMLTSCVGDLDLTPTDPNTKIDLTSKAEWNGYFGSLYGSLLYVGNLSTSDGGAGTFMRCHWNLQEITADEAIISNKWNDPGYHTLNFNTWLTDNEWVYAAFSREFYTARQCTEFLDKADGAREYLGDEEVESMKAEAKVLRCLAYYYMVDLFGKGPYVNDSPTGAIPPTYDRKQLFDAATSELLETINEGHLRPAAQQTYGRLSREAARMLLAKFYLNAGVYTGTTMYAQCAEQCKEILKTINTLAPTYKYLFCASNDKYVGNGEILWAIPQQVGMMETWGGTTYMTAGAYIESAPAEVLKSLGCVATPWSGLRMRPELSTAFEPNDKRALYYAGTFNVGVQDLDNYDENSDGYMCIKYTYTSEDDYENTAGVENAGQMCNADYPLFRLSDTFLMLAECQLNGVECDGKKYFDAVRTRAGLPVAGLTKENLLHERQCELYWEGWRRSDLIRFGKYTGSEYNWSWKGGVYEGVAISDDRALFAIPYQYVLTVGQNPGY